MVKNGQIVPGNVMNVTLSCDHRVVDGATGAAFLQTLKSLLEEPLKNVSVNKKIEGLKKYGDPQNIFYNYFSRGPIKEPLDFFYL